VSKKTVYILGAGASKTSNLPTQAEILPLIFSIRPNTGWQAPDGDDFLLLDLDDKAEKIHQFYPLFDEYRQVLGDFIVENFSSCVFRNIRTANPETSGHETGSIRTLCRLN